jgi:hypothetical protein
MLTIKEARAAIEGILAAIDEAELLKYAERVTTDPEDRTIVGRGGNGYYLGSARRNGEREPLVHRHSGSLSAIEHEMAYRYDAIMLACGDNSGKFAAAVAR